MEGSPGIRTVTDYKLIEVLRGSPAKSLKSMETRSSIPYPGDYTKQLPNFGPQWPGRGNRSYFFPITLSIRANWFRQLQRRLRQSEIPGQPLNGSKTRPVYRCNSRRFSAPATPV